MELSPRAASKAVDSVTAELNGGWLRLYSRDGLELVALRFASPAFQSAIDGKAIGRPLESARAKASGAPVRFTATDAKDRPIASGTVGREGSGEDVTVPVETISAGAEILLHTITWRKPLGG